MNDAERALAGSSPLARGLLTHGGHGGLLSGIIPARAGFTGRPHARRPGRWDHPRSRGVYAAPAVDALQDVRIIPARAGFTVPPVAGGAVEQDHPRSRGVYDDSPARARGAQGSSPLARGLRGLLGVRLGRRRIIPARAGFTASRARACVRVADHPRSRGVYFARGSAKKRPLGSSPLARGLLGVRQAVQHQDGIIPARAGFTTCVCGSQISPRDHPRSRGVYASRPWRGPASPGSSPLARGLLALCTLNEKTFMDHPRSRGVYPRPWTSSPAPPGSSPLARGLLVGPHAGRGHHRIIPARAGFTEPAPRESLRSPDHPRSRGVYADTAVLAAQVLGSSPLARGLPCFLLTHALSYGIIPARAGFTTARRTTCLRRWDHPRSRGVYVGRSARAGPVAGSSPLARGLRHVDDDAAGRARIIPARAGFTRATASRSAWSSGSSPLARGLPLAKDLGLPARRIIPARAGFTVMKELEDSEEADHPRSRGVYYDRLGSNPSRPGSSPLARGLLGTGRIT